VQHAHNKSLTVGAGIGIALNMRGILMKRMGCTIR
jgi:hypothetical protein